VSGGLWIALRRRDEKPTSTGKIAHATGGKFVLNRKLFLLCFHQRSDQDDDFVGFICIE
jgi:hypothetical protein